MTAADFFGVLFYLQSAAAVTVTYLCCSVNECLSVNLL